MRDRFAGGRLQAARFLLFGAGLLVPGQAFAHAFTAGADKYAQFLEGSAVAILIPSMVLPLAALGTLLGLWREDGMVKVWPLYIISLIVGGLTAPLIGPWIIPAFVGLGIIVGAVAALLPKLPAVIAYMAAALTGLGGAMTALEGHTFLELPALTYLGIFFGLNLTVAVTASMVSASLEKWSVGWLRIAWRVAGSWISAILVLYLAFLITTPDAVL